MIEFLKALALWLVVFIPSAGVASSLANRNPKRAAFWMQITMLLVSLPIMGLAGRPEMFGLYWSPRYIPQALLIGFGVSLVLNLIGGNSSMPRPEFLPESLKSRVFLLLLLAPLSEEILNRGLVEGYLLSYGHLWGAIIFAALLFSLPHWMAFEGEKGKKAFIVIGAFVIGSLAGWLFALGGIAAAFVLHASANIAGLTACHLRS